MKKEKSIVVLVFHDVTQARHLAAKLSHQANHDTLTGLILIKRYSAGFFLQISSQNREAISSLQMVDW